MKAMKGRYTIGSTVLIGRDKWVVVKCHKVVGMWEVMFRSLSSGVHKSLPCSQLERYTR